MMKLIRKRLTYANVMSSIAVFAVLGGAAVAATKLPKKSVGTQQLKAGAVTTAKIKKKAVTEKKIKDGAVTNSKLGIASVNSEKIADGSVTGVDINAESTSFARIIAKLRTALGLGLTEAFQNFPLNPPTYTQAADQVDTYYGAVDVTFQSGCAAPREAIAAVLVDSTDPTKLEPFESVTGIGFVEDKAGGTVTKRIEIAPYFFAPISRFESGTARSHTVNLVVAGECTAGSGITATFGGVDVIGTK